MCCLRLIPTRKMLTATERCIPVILLHLLPGNMTGRKIGVNLLGAVTWSFEFENQPWFYGFRDLATNGVDKPVLNVFRMFGKWRANG